MLPVAPQCPIIGYPHSGGRCASMRPNPHVTRRAVFPRRPSGASAAPAIAATAATSNRSTTCTSYCSAPVNAIRRRGGDTAGSARVPRGLSYGVAAAVAAAVAAPDADPPRVEEPSTALLLAWFACGNRSLFAAQCLVEVLVELYREGRTFNEVQLSLKMATQGDQVRRLRRAAGGREVVVPGAIGDGGGGSGGEEGREEEEEVVVLPPLLQGQEEDVLVSWVALVFLTCEELGVPRDRVSAEQRQQQQQQQGDEEEGGGRQRALPAAAAAGGGGAEGGSLGGTGGQGSGSMAAGSAYLRGMLGYVRQTLGMYDEGQTLARVAGLQGLVQQSSGAASSPFLVLMQQYTRLVLLTVEVVAAAGLTTARPLRPPETVTRPSGYSQAFTSSCSATLDDGDNDRRKGDGDGKGPAAAAEACPSRGLAVRLLMAFMGAVLGSLWSLGKFVEAVRVAYDQGLAADELFLQLDEQEFVQSGGLLPIARAGASSTASEASEASPSPAAVPEAAAAAPAQPPQYQITKALLSTWISLSYMTLAQLAVPYPEAGQRLGWAWAGFGDPIEALGMNDFVGNVLRQMAGTDPRVVPQPPPPPLEQQPEQQTPGANAAASEKAGEQEQLPSPSTVGGSRRRDGPLMVRVEDETLPNTSTAVRVMTQQIALVQAVCRLVMTEGQD